MPKPKVVLLLHELSLTGAPKVILDAFAELKKEFDLRIISLNGGPREQECRALAPLWVLLPLQWTNLNRLFWPLVLKARAFFLKLWNPQLIYVNALPALRIREILNLPFVPALLHVHELDSVLVTWIISNGKELLVEWPNRYIAVSQAVVKALREKAGIQENKISLVHEFVPEADINPATRKSTEVTPWIPLRGLALQRQQEKEPTDAGFLQSIVEQSLLGQSFRISPWSFSKYNHVPPKKFSHTFVIGGAGSLEWGKGPTLWLQMASRLQAILGDGNVRFVWVGMKDNLLGWQCREMAKKLCIESSVEFVPLTDKPLEYFKNFDIFALTSWEDSCPIVVLECMMLKKVVVCFENSGGAPEEIGDTGIVVGNFSPDEMAKAIAALAQDPKRCEAMGQAAFERVSKYFTSSVQVPKIRQEIYSLLAARGSNTK